MMDYQTHTTTMTVLSTMTLIPTPRSQTPRGKTLTMFRRIPKTWEISEKRRESLWRIKKCSRNYNVHQMDCRNMAMKTFFFYLVLSMLKKNIHISFIIKNSNHLYCYTYTYFLGFFCLNIFQSIFCSSVTQKKMYYLKFNIKHTCKTNHSKTKNRKCPLKVLSARVLGLK